MNKSVDSVDNMYKNAQIYKVVSPSHPELVYYGSTCTPLRKRMNTHKHPTNKSNSRLITCFEDCTIVLVENFPCKSKAELYAREYHYISNNQCVNKMGRHGFRLGREKEYSKERNKLYRETHKDKVIEQQKEYYEANKDKLLEQRKEYYEAHKDKIIEQMSVKVTCECGSEVRHGSIATHKRTIKHTNFMLTLE